MHFLALFPGPAQLSIACRRAWERGYARLVSSPVEVLVSGIKVTSKWQKSADETTDK